MISAMQEAGTQGTGSQALVVTDRMRELSKRVLGSMDRLEVALAVAGKADGLVDAMELSKQLDLANNRVRTQLLVFVDGGFLAALPHRMGQKRYYERLDHPYWSTLVETARRWSRDG
jgi:hypothetical protein